MEDFLKAAFSSAAGLGIGKTTTREDKGVPEISITIHDCESNYYFRVIKNEHADAQFTYWQNFTNLPDIKGLTFVTHPLGNETEITQKVGPGETSVFVIKRSCAGSTGWSHVLNEIIYLPTEKLVPIAIE